MKMKKLILLLIGCGCLLATQTGVNAQILINGAGSTFDYPAFTKWFEAYGKVDPDVQLQLPIHRLRRRDRNNCSTRPWISALPTRR